jgi:hypothetical protein
MPYHASAIPYENTSTIYDYGAKIALWVSAFEVLVRSETERASCSRDLDLLGIPKFCALNLNKKLYTIQFSKRYKKRGTLPQKLYHMLYLARNDFLHGNPVNVHNCFIKGSDKYYQLTVAAPLIYKVALQSFLNIPKLKSIADINSFGEYANARNFEEAISALIQKRPRRKKHRRKVN